MEQSGLPKAKQKAIELQLYDNCDEEAYGRLFEIKDNILDFVNNGNNLIIAGENTGNGKTSWSIKLLHKYFDKVWRGNHFRVRGIFVHVPTLLLMSKSFDSEDRELLRKQRQRILNADLVVWDDVASFDMSPYDYSNLLMYLDNRLLAEKSNIFTSNSTTEQQFLDFAGQRLTSRVWLVSEKVILNGTDKRGIL
jgi:DNA replication protein DnaC